MTYIPKPAAGASLLMAYCPRCRVWDDVAASDFEPCSSRICGLCGKTGLVAPTRFSRAAAKHERGRFRKARGA